MFKRISEHIEKGGKFDDIDIERQKFERYGATWRDNEFCNEGIIHKIAKYYKDRSWIPMFANFNLNALKDTITMKNSRESSCLQRAADLGKANFIENIFQVI